MEVKIGGAGVQPAYPTQVQPDLSQEPALDNQKAPKPIDSGKHYSREELATQIEAFNNLLQANQSHVRFTLHDGLNEYYVQVVDDKTNQIIREIPSKKMMDTVAKLYEMIGLLVDHKL